MYSIKTFQAISISRAEIGQKMSKKTDNSVLSSIEGYPAGAEKGASRDYP